MPAIAQQNREYYEQEAKENNEPWHWGVKYPYKYSESIEITPEMARTILTDSTRSSLAEKLLKEIESGKAATNFAIKDIVRGINNCAAIHLQICIDVDYNIIDGVYNCSAIIVNNKPANVIVEFNHNSEGFEPIEETVKKHHYAIDDPWES